MCLFEINGDNKLKNITITEGWVLLYMVDMCNLNHNMKIYAYHVIDG